MCKSMGISQSHDLLLSFYGKERLRYIYLYRDPRDVCLSFMKTPVGDCHPYAIAKKWAKLQNFAARILHETPDLVHLLSYESILGDKASQVAKILTFMGEREVSRAMRRGSIIASKNDIEVASGAKKGRETIIAGTQSSQFTNLVRGDSFLAGQLMKWKKEMNDEDLLIVESVALHEMSRLGYELHKIKNEDDRIEFTVKLCAEYTAENKCLIEKMNADLAIDDPEDLKRRQIQNAVLDMTVQEYVDDDFVKCFINDIYDELDVLDITPKKQFLRGRVDGSVNFRQWPLDASSVGFSELHQFSFVQICNVDTHV